MTKRDRNRPPKKAFQKNILEHSGTFSRKSALEDAPQKVVKSIEFFSFSHQNLAFRIENLRFLTFGGRQGSQLIT